MWGLGGQVAQQGETVNIITHYHRAGYAIGRGLVIIWQRWQPHGRMAAAVKARQRRQNQRAEVREPSGAKPLAGKRAETAEARKGSADGSGHQGGGRAFNLRGWQRRVLRYCAEDSATGRELLAVAGYAERTGNFKRGLLKLRRLELLEFSIPDRPRSKRQRYRLTPRGERYLAEQ